MKKVKEINLNPGYGLDSYPMQKRETPAISGGGPSMSADSAYSRNTLKRVNKNMKNKDDESEEELDNFVDTVNLIKEFGIPDNMSDKIMSLGKTGLMSIPVFGDVFAFSKFLYTIYKLRKATNKFTKKLSEMTEIDLGNDFLEAEGSIASESSLNNNLTEATYRLSNLKNYPELDISMIDIHNLSDKYFQVFRYCKDAIMEFIGFADAPFAQQGAYINIGVSMLTYSEFPDFLLGTYAEYIDDLTLRAEAKSSSENKKFTSLIDTFKDIANDLISVPRKLMDFLGNLDILINKEKLERLAMVHNVISMYDDVDTDKEKYDFGLDAEPGTSYSEFLKNMGLDTSEINLAADVMNNLKLQEAVKSMSFYLQEDYNLIDLYDDDNEEDSVEEQHMVGGGTAPIGKKLDGSTETSAQRKDRHKKANIYAEEVRKLQEWKLKTTGRIK